MNADLLGLLVGILVLLLGQKLFWLFVGVMGFLWGFQVAPRFFSADSQVLIFAVALLIGLIGAVLAVWLQHVAVAIVGFLAGSHLTTVFLNGLNLQVGEAGWWISLVGGIIGLILAIALLDWALIILSSVVGASLICQALPLEQAMFLICFVILAAVGIVVQSSITRRTATAV